MSQIGIDCETPSNRVSVFVFLLLLFGFRAFNHSFCPPILTCDCSMILITPTALALPFLVSSRVILTPT